MDEIEKIIQRHAALKGDRGKWESHWQEVIDYVCPRMGRVFGSSTEGEKRGQTTVFDSTAIHDHGLLASALHGMLTNPASQWFELRPPDPAMRENKDIREWCEEAAWVIMAEIDSSNFDQSVHELYLDITSIGTAGMMIEEGEDTSLLFTTLFIGEFCISENKEGRVDSVFREFEWTARQCFQKWGEACSQKTKDLYAKAPDTKLTVVHAVYPREEYDRRKWDKLNRPFGDVYFEAEARHVLQRGGFFEFPFVVPRWGKQSREKYGRSPAMEILPDTKRLNKVAQTLLRAGQKVVDPPIFVPDKSFLGPIRTAPSAISYYQKSTVSDKTDILTLPQGRLDIGEATAEGLRGTVHNGFYVDQLQMAQGPQMTATEVLQRTEEKLRILGPVLGRLKSEFLQPFIARVFGILLRAGKLPKPPAELGGAVMVEYVSPIAKAQKVAEMQATQRTLELGGAMAGFAPDVFDNFDTDKIAQGSAEFFGMPADWMRDKKDIQAIRQKRIEDARQAQELAQAQAGAKMGKDIAGMAGMMQ